MSSLAEFYGVTSQEIKRRQRGGLLRPITVRMLLRYDGKTQREIASMFGLPNEAAVSFQLRGLAKKEGKDDRKVREDLQQLGQILDSQIEAGS